MELGDDENSDDGIRNTNSGSNFSTTVFLGKLFAEIYKIVREPKFHLTSLHLF